MFSSDRWRRLDVLRKDGTDYHNQVQIVQTYYDTFSLASLNIRENRGTDYAILYEDPTADNDLNIDVPLYRAKWVSTPPSSTGATVTSPPPAADAPAMASRHHRQRTRGMPTIADRFDRDQNGGVTDIQRWSLPNIFQVVTKSYTHRDLALGKIGSIEGKEHPRDQL